MFSRKRTGFAISPGSPTGSLILADHQAASSLRYPSSCVSGKKCDQPSQKTGKSRERTEVAAHRQGQLWLHLSCSTATDFHHPGKGCTPFPNGERQRWSSTYVRACTCPCYGV